MSFRDRLSRYTPKNLGPLPGDLYVAPYGSDDNDGSLEHPFATVQRAAQAVRKMDKSVRSHIAVCLMAGEYITDGIFLTEEDSGTESCPVIYRAYGDGEVILNGGVSLNNADFEPTFPNGDSRQLHDSRSRSPTQSTPRPSGVARG